MNQFKVLSIFLLVSCSLLVGANYATAADEVPASEPGEQIRDGFIQLDETVISGNQELPKVLYILPWQQPNGLPDIELKADFTEADVFRRLYPPAYRRELQYFETLESIKSTESEE